VSLTILLLFEQEEYDRKLADAIAQGSTVDHSLTFRTWKKVAGDKKKGKLYGLGNLAANYRKGSVASTLQLTLNHGEGSSQQPELTPEMRELIHRLTQEQFAQQMASQAAVVMCVLYDRFSHAFIYLISCSGIFREVSYTSRYNFYLFDTYDVILVQF